MPSFVIIRLRGIRRSAEETIGLPEEEAGGDGDVEGVLGAFLGDLDAEVGHIDYALVDAVDFVAGYYGYFCAFGIGEVGEVDAPFDLFENDYHITFAAEGLDGFGGCWEIAPGYRPFGTEGCLVYFRGGWGGRDTAQAQVVDAEGVGSAENRAYIVEGAYVVEHYDYG